MQSKLNSNPASTVPPSPPEGLAAFWRWLCYWADFAWRAIYL